MYNKDVVKPAPDSWGVVFGRPESQKYKGKVTAYDNPIYIADAALYLKATQPDLGIDNVYELDDKQFNAAVDLLKQQRPVHRRVLVRLHQGAGGVHRRRLCGRHHLAGDREPGRGGQEVAADRGDPAQGGRDRVVGHLDDLLKGQAPELHVQVDGPHHQPPGERRGGRVVRRGPGQQEVVCDDGGRRTTARSTTRTTRRTSTGWPTGTRRRRTAATTAGDTCKDYSEWVKAWTEIKG